MQAHASIGDVIFADYLLSHNSGGNMSDVVRKTICMRPSRPNNQAEWREIFADLLHEYDGVRAALGLISPPWDG